MATKKHKDLEFHVDDAGGVPRVFKDWGEAVAFAVALSVSNGRSINVDVIAWSRAAARHWMGDHGVEMYDEDPEASVFQRVSIRAEDRGRVY